MANIDFSNIRRSGEKREKRNRSMITITLKSDELNLLKILAKGVGQGHCKFGAELLRAAMEAYRIEVALKGKSEYIESDDDEPYNPLKE